jgi:DNA-directed RNA polymerase subunit RPC12/RpoP
MNTAGTGHGASSTSVVWRTRIAGRKGGSGLRIPDEYVCDLCGYEFLSGEVPELFCPNCGSSMVVKEITYDEFFDEEPFIGIINMSV